MSEHLNLSQSNMRKKVAIITGAAGSLGSALVLKASQANWETVLIDKDKKALELLYDEAVSSGGVEPLIHEMDLASADPDQCRKIVVALEDGGGRLDALIHCAVSFDGLQPLDHIPPHDWLRHMQVNLNAPWLLSVTCLPMLRRSGQASLFFLCEDLIKVSGSYWGAYGVSKHAVHALASQFSSELGNTNIQVLALDPGPMRSPLRSRVYHTENPGACKSPDGSAQKILALMERKIAAPEIFVNLNELALDS